MRRRVSNREGFLAELNMELSILQYFFAFLAVKIVFSVDSRIEPEFIILEY